MRNSRASVAAVVIVALAFAYWQADQGDQPAAVSPGAAENPGSASGTATAESPNVLIIITDDQRWDELGVVQQEQGEAARFPYLETPHLDRLAQQGMRFRNAFVTTSLCSPSRSAILTGQYNHVNKIIDNQTFFVARPTWATALRDAGYETAYFGKWHHGPQWDRPGFDYIATFRGQGKYYDTDFKINGELVQTKGYIDDRSVDFAIDYLQKRPDKPFAMTIGFKAVHQPVTPRDVDMSAYAKERIDVPPSWNALAPFFERTHPLYFAKPNRAAWWARLVRPRKVNGIDHNVGRLLTALDELDLSDKTLVVFLSDNGFFLGEHRLGDKRAAYEESMRIPMLVRLPGVVPPGTTSDAMVLNIDIAPTLLELAQVPVPDAMQGSSWEPLFRQDETGWRDAFLYEYWQEYDFRRQDWITGTRTTLAVRTDRYKLVTYPEYEHWMELYDLVADPYETRNLAEFRGYRDIREQLCTRLTQLMEETGYQAMPTLSNMIELTRVHQTLTGRFRKAVPYAPPPLRQPHC